MFIGHYAIGFMLKKVEPRLSLGTLIFGTAMLDILFGFFLLTGVEHARIVPGATAVSPFEFYDYPVSHSVLGAAFWAAIGFLVYWLWPKKDHILRKQPAFVFAAAIFSHIILDIISHTPDITIFGNNSPGIGLSLWNSIAGTMIVEIGLFFIGVFLYMRTTYSASSAGKYGFASFVLILMVLYIANTPGSPPPNTVSMGITAIAGQLVFVAIAFWVDRNRIIRSVDKVLSGKRM